MITFTLKKQNTKIPKQDYIFEKEELFLKLLDVLTPKFEGMWEIALINPEIRFVNEFLERTEELPHININIYLASSKMDAIMLKHPKLMPKRQTNKEAFLELVSSLKNDLSHTAAKYLYNACSGDVETATEVLQKLDTECTGGIINVEDVKNVYMLIRKPLYASTVYRAFMCNDRERWKLLDKLDKDIGTKFAYYALRKQSVQWLEEKSKYLMNEDTKNWNISDVDATYICFAYLCFVNSNAPEELYSVMHDIDTRGEKVLERRLYANIQ